MTVITISRGLGAGGTGIAARVAATFGYCLAGKDQIAEVLIKYGMVHFEEVYDSAPGIWARFDSRRAEMTEMLNRVIEAIAHSGNVVIVGRQGFAVLAGLADAVRVRAPLPVRVQRVMQERGIVDPIECQKLVRESDRIRRAFVEQSYGVSWDAASAFDLVIDTGKVPPDLACDLVEKVVRHLQESGPAGKNTAARLEIDATLARAVAEVLSTDEEFPT
jgi:cytidylate kinase